MGGELTFSLGDMNVETKDVNLDNEAPENNGTDQQASGSDEDQSQDVLENTENNNNESSDDADGGAEREENENGEQQSSQEEQTPSSDKDSSQKSTLYALAQHLKEEGVLFIDDIDKVESLADLKDLIGKSNEKARYANLTESQKRYQDALQNGVPVSEFEKVEKQIQTFAEIKADNIATDANLRYEILAIDMIDQGMDKEKAMKFAKLSVNDEGSVTEAQSALTSILERRKEQAKTLVDTAKDKKETTISEYKKNIFEKEKLLDTKLNDTTKNKLFDLITTRVDSDEQGKPLNELQKWQKENPVESGIMMNYLYMMTNKGKDINMFLKKGTTEASKDLEKKLKQNLNFDENGSLIIPDSMLSGNSNQNNNSNKDKPNINI